MTTAVVVTFNAARTIRSCLESLGGLRVIVLDNASQDGTADLVESLALPTVQLVRRDSNAGLSVAVNEGIALAGDDDVLILNPDVVVEPGAVALLSLYLHEHPEVGIVAPALRYPNGDPQLSVRRFPTIATHLARRTPFGRTRRGIKALEEHLYHWGVGADRRVDWALGAALLVRREALRTIKGMDPRYFLYAEDTDLCWRAWQQGWEVHLEPQAVVVHEYQRMSSGGNRTALKHHLISLAKLYAQHPGMLVGRSPVAATVSKNAKTDRPAVVPAAVTPPAPPQRLPLATAVVADTAVGQDAVLPDDALADETLVITGLAS
jgi:GT2 family glycosyltransferase